MAVKLRENKITKNEQYINNRNTNLVNVPDNNTNEILPQYTSSNEYYYLHEPEYNILEFIIVCSILFLLAYFVFEKYSLSDYMKS